MVKAEVKTPNKRKSFANESPSKKVKLENGNQKPFSPKKEKQTPPKNNQLQSPNVQKSNKKQKFQQNTSPEEKKGIKPFAGTKQLKEGKKGKFQGKPQNNENKQAQGPKKEKPQNVKSEKPQEGKRKRKNQFQNLIVDVKAKQGTKDAELLKKLNERIEAITSRNELTKTAKKKLAILKKLKFIVEEGSAAASAQSKAQIEAEKAAKAAKKAEKKPAVQQQPKVEKKKPVAKAVPVKKEVKQEEDDDDEDEEDSDAESSSDAEEEDSDAEEEGEDDEGSDEVEGEEDEEDDDDEEEDGDDDDEEDDDDDDDDDEFEEKFTAPPQEKPSAKKLKTETPPSKQGESKRQQPTLDDLEKKDIVKKGQKRFVLFVGNIPYDTTKDDLAAHFNKVGDIVDIRLPTIKGSNKPRGFAYIEVKNEIAYEKCLSMHHSQIKGRRINVLYTQGGKKKGDDKKKEIKAKNMKLHAMRKQGKLAGSVKQTQKRSFRRNKSKIQQPSSDS